MWTAQPVSVSLLRFVEPENMKPQRCNAGEWARGPTPAPTSLDLLCSMATWDLEARWVGGTNAS